MLTRRQIRIKTFQALYAYYNSDVESHIALKNLERSLEQIYPLFLLELKALQILRDLAERKLEKAKQKLRPSQEDLTPNTRFIENTVLLALKTSQFNAAFEHHKIHWGDDKEILVRILKALREDDFYIEYVKGNHISDSKFVLELYKKYFAHNDTLHQVYEDRNIHWADDLEAAQMLMVKCLENMDNEQVDRKLPELFKDEDDRAFAGEIFKQTLKNNEYFDKLISAKAQNWEQDRIASVDKILMKMALSEFISFDQIPVKVTINEYIELTKMYSTPKSGTFINGILDKLQNELSAENKIKKIGRGLM